MDSCGCMFEIDKLLAINISSNFDATFLLFPLRWIIMGLDVFLSVCSYNTHAVMYFKKGDSQKQINISKLIPKTLDKNNSCKNNLRTQINIHIIWAWIKKEEEHIFQSKILID